MSEETSGPGGPQSHATDGAPETIEGWFVLHDGYRLRWDAWRALKSAHRDDLVAELITWQGAQESVHKNGHGDSAVYEVIGHKADLLWVHYRRTPSELAHVQRSLQACRIYDLLEPSVSYLSVVEASLYEATGIARSVVARRGLKPGDQDYERTLADEIDRQKDALHQRVFRTIPEQAYVCYYPMSKRRGEHVNWYDMPLEERRALMRGHGRIGHKYVDRLTQVISGSVGLDDWEWAVDLHADDPLLFKKLIYEMRFDPASARFAEFGEFVVGMRRDHEGLRTYLHL